MDVGNAYLNASVTEDIYMHQPQGYQKLGDDNQPLVCKLKKGLYGLKQAGRNWNSLIDKWLRGVGLSRCHSDFCLYHRKNEGNILIIGLYVDDLVIVANSLRIL